MIIQFKDLLQSKKIVEIKEQVNMNELLTSRPDTISSDLVDVRLQAEARNDQTVWVSGQCNASMEFVCSRCLNPFHQTLEIQMTEVFTKDQETATADEDEITHLVIGDKVELLPYIEENVMLGLPLFPLCNMDCLGLCALCGQNKNEQSCECKEDTTDPRLAGLKDFFTS